MNRNRLNRYSMEFFCIGRVVQYMFARRVVVLAVMLVALALQFASMTSVCAADEQVDSVKALRALKGNSWYDADESTYKPPVISKPVDDSIRRNGWEAKPSTWDWNWDWDWNFSGSGFGNLGISADSLGWFILIVLGIALTGGLVAILYFYLRDSLPFQKRSRVDSKQLKFDPTKVEDLPFEVVQKSGNPLSDAEALMRAGKYNEAIVYLYGYMLLTLDHARKIHLQKGKTNRMYLRELRGQTSLSQIVNRTMLAFEDVFFGRYDIDAGRFAKLWGQMEEFHRLVQPAPTANPPADRKVATI